LVRVVLTRCVRAVRLLARDGRIPRPLRWAAAFGVLPIPGPLDEVVLVLVAGVLWLFYRDRLRDAWAQTGDTETQQESRSSLSRITGA
jgi:hypothetical protein